MSDSSLSTPRWISFGRVHKAHGVNGQIRITPWNAGDPWPETAEEVRLCLKDGSTQDYRVEALRPIHEAFLVTLQGVTDRDVAHALKGAEVELPADSIPPPEEGEYYTADLVGLEVHDDRGEHVGRITQVDDNNGQDLLEIRTPKGRTRLYPLVDDTLVDLDWEAGKMTVKHIPGLWE